MITKKRRGVDEINSSSMADIAFLLLIFFLVTTTIDPGEGLTMVLPPYEADPLVKDQKDIVKILVRPSGEVLFDGEFISIEQVELSAKNKVTEFQAVFGAIDENNKPKQPIFVVETAEKAKYQIFLEVLDGLKEANCRKISVVES